jgi:hypothetical protein
VLADAAQSLAKMFSQVTSLVLPLGAVRMHRMHIWVSPP